MEVELDIDSRMLRVKMNLGKLMFNNQIQQLLKTIDKNSLLEH